MAVVSQWGDYSRDAGKKTNLPRGFVFFRFGHGGAPRSRRKHPLVQWRPRPALAKLKKRPYFEARLF